MSAHIVSALPIPFTAAGDLDRAEYLALLERVHPHIDGALVAGTTGEFPALDDDERIEVFRTAVEVLGAERTIAHLGHASTRQILRLAERAAGLGISRFALLSPYYLPTDDDGVVAFFSSLTQHHPDALVYAYLFPERTGMDVSVGTLRRVMELPGMVGVKLSGGASTARPEYATALTAGQELYSGDDSTLPQVVADGGTGVVSGVSSAFPETFARLSRAIQDGSPADVDVAQEQVREVVALTGPSVARLKLAIAVRTGGDWAHRMSLPAVDEGTAAGIKDAVARYA